MNNSTKYTNIDGNNRINAICHFIDKPFELFEEYLDEIYSFIDTHITDITFNEKIKKIFKLISYSDIMNLRFNMYFNDIGEHELYNNCLLPLRDEFETYIYNIQKKLKINETDNFDTTVKINFSRCEGYSADELCKLYIEINQFDNKLTELDLLAARLFSIDSFTIENNIILTSIKNEVRNFYNKKQDNEVLKCYQFDSNETINGYDFMVGFQNDSHNKCVLIEEVSNDGGLSLFFKIYKALYKGEFENIFTSENVNHFIVNITKTIEILNKITNTIFTDNLTGTGKVFDACNKKVITLKKNNMFLIILSIIGYFHINEKEDIIINSIEKCILYHFFFQDVSNKDTKKTLEVNDSLTHDGAGALIDTLGEKLYKFPTLISEKITEEVMADIVRILFEENNNPKDRWLDSGKKQNDKRRNRKLYEKILWFYYFKQRVPTNQLRQTFWIEHICLFCSIWENQIDIDRIGNTIPIIDNLNNKRGSKHISEYEKNDKYNFMNFINDIIPSYTVYDEIVSHTNKQPEIINNSKYSDLCEKNEKTYLNIFINCLYKK